MAGRFMVTGHFMITGRQEGERRRALRCITRRQMLSLRNVCAPVVDKLTHVLMHMRSDSVH